MAPKKKATTPASSTSAKSLADLKGMNKSELNAELTLARKELYVLTMKKELGELKQSHLMKKSRRYIAQISTFLTSTL
jgi:ribosomal protein L29